MRVVARRFLGVILLGLTVAAGRAQLPPPVETRLKHGDDPRYALPDWNDRDWELRTPPPGNAGGTLPGRTGVYWVRFRLERSLRSGPRPVLQPYFWPSDEPDSPINCVFISAVFAYEFYWDGRLLGRNGVVGTSRATEVVGPLDNYIMIPEELRGPGPHVVAMRMSSYHYNFPAPTFTLYLALENYLARLLYETRQSQVPLSVAGAAVLAAVVCGAMYGFVDRRRTLLWCSLLGLTVAAFYVMIAWRWLHPDTYDWLAPRYQLITALMALIALLLPWLLLEQFAVPHRRWWLLALVPALVVAWLEPYYAWEKTLWMCRTMLLFSLGVTVWAVWRRRLGARFVLVGVLIGLGDARPENRSFFGPSFFLAFGGTGLGVLTAIGAQVQADRRRVQTAMLTTARLEIELLKKNIQPHFLMNTLTTIMEVIEQEPKSAVAMIEALSGEFRILARVAGERLIPLGQELELCRAHLRIMSLRRGVECSLTTSDVDEQAFVPPALFHTLVEGGVTHQIPRAGKLAFILAGTHEPDVARYTLTVLGDNPLARGPVRDGTGLRYVKARLEESFAGRWTLSAGSVAEGWRTVIEIRGPSGSAA